MSSKLTQFKKGVIPWNKGKTGVYSEETRKKMGKPKAPNKKGGIKKGQKLSKKHREAISIGHKGLKTGEKSNFWKGGISSENNKIRHSYEYNFWRKSCFERDNFTCQKTGQRGGRLVVHHINNFSEFPELRFVIENGITLSEDAHKEFHKIYGLKNNTREQLLEFLKLI